jgi:hypothetical protein
VLKCGKLSQCRNKEVTLSVGRCDVVTVVSVCQCLLGDGLPFVLVDIHSILKDSYASVFGVEVQYSVCRLIFWIVHVTREVQLSFVTSQGLCFMAVRMSKCSVNSAV